MADMIQLEISADSSELVAAQMEVREELQETESAFQRFGNACVSAMNTAGNATVAVIKEVSGEIHAFAQGALSTFGQEVGKYYGQILLYGTATRATTSILGSLWTTMRLGLSVAAQFVPWLKVVTIGLTAATVATWTYRAANEALGGELSRSVVNFQQSAKGWKEYKEAGDQVYSTLGNVGNELLAVGGAAGKIVADVTGVTAAFKALDEVVGGTLQYLADSNREWAEGVQIIVDVTLDWVDAGNQSAASLRAQAAASEALIAKQEAQSELFGKLREVQDAATAAAAHNGEVQRIASLQSQEAIDGEIRALQKKASEAVIAGEATNESLKRTGELFAALENQRLKIESDAAAKAALDAKQKELETQKAINKAKEDAKRLEESAAENIARLRDQIDLASGAASEGEIAFRQMLRQGHDVAAAEEVARLTNELNKIKDDERDANKKPDTGKPDRTSLKAAFAGSQEAASIMLRGVGSPNNDVEQKQLNALQQILIATKANKTQQLIPLTLGVA